MTDSLPVFTYHPDPVATGSVVPSAATCRCCERARGYVYVGPVYAEAELGDALCPWCIADGSAAERFDAEFVDAAGVGDHGAWAPVPAGVAAEVARRTPGFSGWQQERWWTHCGDAAQYLGPAGAPELRAAWAGALPAIQADVGFEGADWDDYLAALDRVRGPTAYVFRCRHCGQLGGYSDVH
ncbi:MAG TPA: CbrC family protein [Gemmatirosa sp.]|nr:CbrC family protein [Gemmatirosa sp.]